MKWKIYYGDRTTFTDEDGNPEDAPCRNVQVIAQVSDRVGKYFCRSDDFYIFDESIGGWQGVDIAGFYDYLFRPGLKIVKFGRTISNEEWNDILGWAMKEDDYLPPKSGWLKRERRPNG